MSRYIPVAAKRDALRIYRDRRRGGGNPLDPSPRSPLAAMRATVEFFGGHCVAAMAAGDKQRAAEMLDRYRAADFYLLHMPSALMFIGPEPALVRSYAELWQETTTTA